MKMNINSGVDNSVDKVVCRIAKFSNDDVFYQFAHGLSKKIY
jgi:hypothetical protein